MESTRRIEHETEMDRNSKESKKEKTGSGMLYGDGRIVTIIRLPGESGVVDRGE